MRNRMIKEGGNLPRFVFQPGREGSGVDSDN